MKNIDVLKQTLLKNFSSMVFHMARHDYETQEKFESLLKIPSELENVINGALQNLQRPTTD